MAIEDWAIQEGLRILNDGSYTRQNPSTGGRSTPDITLVTSELQRTRNFTWSTQSGIGSDHLPILTTLSSVSPRQKRLGKGRFSYRKADWTKFRAKLDETIAT